MKTYSFIINGRSVQTSEYFKVKNPANDWIVGMAQKADEKLLDTAGCRVLMGKKLNQRENNEQF
jgi:hypothetical protein